MPRKCIVFGCRSGYRTTKAEKAAGLGDYIMKSVFRFPDDNDIYNRWLKFANREDLKLPPSGADDDSCGICIDHFEEKYLKFGKSRNRLDSSQQHVPTIQTDATVLSNPSLIRFFENHPQSVPLNIY